MPFLPGDTLLLCSYGVHDTLREWKLESLFDPHRPVEDQVAVIRAAVLAAGAPGNFSLILARRSATNEEGAAFTE